MIGPFVSCTKLWNALPSEIRQAESFWFLNLFLKHFFFTIAFKNIKFILFLIVIIVFPNLFFCVKRLRCTLKGAIENNVYIIIIISVCVCVCVCVCVVVLSDNHQRAVFGSAHCVLNNMPHYTNSATGEKHDYFAEDNFV